MLSFLNDITCEACEENTWYYLKKGWGEFRKHNCFGQGPMCRECTMHAEHHSCSCCMTEEYLLTDDEEELEGYAEEYLPTLVYTVIAPFLYQEDDIESCASNQHFLDHYTSLLAEHVALQVLA